MDASVFNPYQFFVAQSQSNRWLKAEAADLLKSLNLTLMEWLLLMAIKENKQGLTITEAAELLGVSLPQITSLTQSLVRQNAVKQKVLSSDRRSRELMLTQKGTALCASSEMTVREGLLKKTQGPNPLFNYCLLLQEVVKLPLDQ